MALRAAVVVVVEVVVELVVMGAAEVVLAMAVVAVVEVLDVVIAVVVLVVMVEVVAAGLLVVSVVEVVEVVVVVRSLALLLLLLLLLPLLLVDGDSPETCKMSARALGLFTFEVSGLRSTTMTLLCEVGGAAVVRAGVVMGPRGTEGGFCSTGAPELPLKVFPMVILVGTSLIPWMLMGLIPDVGAPLCTTITLDLVAPRTGRSPQEPWP